MQRLHNITRWQHASAEKLIAFERQRSVKMRVSTPYDTHWLIIDENGPEDQEPQFMAATSGFEVLEFTPYEGMTIYPTDNVMYQMTEGQTRHLENPGNPAFTRIHEFRPRNPQMERMMREAEYNMMRRMEKLDAAREVRHATEIAALKEQFGYDPETGEISDEASTDAADGAGPPAKKSDGAQERDGVVAEERPGTSTDQKEAQASEPPTS